MSSSAYMAANHMRRYWRIRGEMVIALGGKCARCQATDDLQFDHVDPSTKSFDIGSRLLVLPLESLWDELGKCQLLCQPCHNNKTLAENGQNTAQGTHGTLSAYRYCHCVKCRAAHAAWTREYRKTHPRRPQSVDSDAAAL